ncbi:MAG: c-type cytochrome [Bacteroidota bacterium]
MKKILIIASAVTLLLVACNNEGGKEKKDAGTGEKTETGPAPSESPDYGPGLAVISKSDCETCHKIDVKVQGPTYTEIASKYADSSRSTIIPHLANKIISGGTGVWGDIPMIPHPGLTKEEAEAAVKYVLLFKSK